MTGKNKIQFEEYLINNVYSEGEYHNNEDALLHFYNLKPEMQIGVFIAYYDSVGHFIGCDSYSPLGKPNDILFWVNIKDSNQVSMIIKTHFDSDRCSKFKTRLEAQNAALKKANELINEQLNKQDLTK
jgi:hypothetical protein